MLGVRYSVAVNIHSRGVVDLPVGNIRRRHGVGVGDGFTLTRIKATDRIFATCDINVCTVKLCGTDLAIRPHVVGNSHIQFGVAGVLYGDGVGEFVAFHGLVIIAGDCLVDADAGVVDINFDSIIVLRVAALSNRGVADTAFNVILSRLVGVG